MQCAEIRDIITDRTDDYARVLLSGVAFFNASDRITRQDWRSFYESQQIEKQLPGIQGFGFSLLIRPEQLTRHSEEIRSEGFPSYTVKPEGKRDLYSAIIYLEPFDLRNQQAFGYDMFSEPVRREAMEMARDTGVATLSGKVTLVQEIDENIQVGTLMYVPVYRKGYPVYSVEERRAAIYGWVYSPYRMTDLIEGMLGTSALKKAQQLHLQIFDGNLPSPETLLYQATHEGQPLPKSIRFAQEIAIPVKGRLWTLGFIQTTPGLFSAEFQSVWLILIAGTLISTLIFFHSHPTGFKKV